MQMRHRGPDDGGTWFDDEVVIGFRRLSLIDWEHSHQPLPYLDDRYHLIFNGEIYNYLELRAQLTEEFGASFATNGDGEAIVAGYHYLGEKIVEHLRGMFAFLIWDSEERVMFGARDWFGIKPLYTYTDERGSFFASEKKALLAVAAPGVSQEVNTEALQHYLTLAVRPGTGLDAHARSPGSTPAPRSRCGPASRSRPGATSGRTSRSEPVSEPDKLYREIADALRDSVAKHLRSDFTVGSFLSGGIDSTAIAALAREHNPKLLTFTTGFERAGFSEIDVAAESAAAIGVEHITKVVSAAGDDGHPAADRLVPRRSGGRPGAGAAVLHRPRGPQARQGGAVRRGGRRAVRRLHHLPRADLAAPADRRAGSGEAAARAAVGPAAGGHARQGPAAPGLDRDRGALLRQRPDLPRRRAASRC